MSIAELSIVTGLRQKIDIKSSQQMLPFALDHDRVRRNFEYAAPGYDQAAVLHREVAGRLLERLELVKLAPKVVLDSGCGTGFALRPLLKRYRKTIVIGLDYAPAMLAQARQRRYGWYKPRWLCAKMQQLPLANASCDLIFSNLVLQWCGDLDGALQELRRLLKPGGLLLFSTLGPDTLKELRESWAAADDRPHVHGFIDMHDIGDALIRAAFADPVMDMEHITMTYQQVSQLLADLKAVGACNAAIHRRRSLIGKRRFQTMLEAYERLRCDGRLPATYEIIYGHAWLSTEPRAQQRADGSVAFPLSQLRRRR